MKDQNIDNYRQLNNDSLMDDGNLLNNYSNHNMNNENDKNENFRDFNNNNNTRNHYQQSNPQYQQQINPQYQQIPLNPQNQQYNPQQQYPQSQQFNPQSNQNQQFINQQPYPNQQYTNPQQPYQNQQYQSSQPQQFNPQTPIYNSQNQQNNGFYQQLNQPKVPKILDMKDIEKEFLQNTEYKRTYNQNAQSNISLELLKNANYFAFNEYDKKTQLKKYQEHALLQKVLYDQIEEKRRKTEEQKQAELLKQQQEEERLKRQRDEILDKYNRDMEKKQMELQAIKENSQKTILKNPNKTINEISRIEENKKVEENNAIENSRLMDELKIKEEDKLKEIQRQKAVYEEKLQDVNSHLTSLKNQLFSQQNMLNEELNKLKAESLMANEQRYRSQRELENLREELKRQELMEDIRRTELNQALIKTKSYRDSDPNQILYPKFARDFNKAFRFHQINNEYLNDSLDNLVQRTNFIPITDYSKPLNYGKRSENLTNFNKNYEDFDYTNSLTQATKVQTLPRSLVKGYENDDGFNALDVIRTNEERLEELKKLDRSDGVDMQGKLDSLINDMNRK